MWPERLVTSAPGITLNSFYLRAAFLPAKPPATLSWSVIIIPCKPFLIAASIISLGVFRASNLRWRRLL